MNPQLQNPGMAIHPPNLYLGYVATSIPFAFAIAALVTRRLDAEWLGIVRRWSLLSWFFLTIGITLGMWWAYVELGWSGYWAWDPVENASLLPWLTGTAFLHSIMIQEKRGMLRKWNVTLVVTTFLLAIFGTFITRSGIIESVHSFAQSPVGTWFATFFLLATATTIYFVSTRLKDLEAKAGLESMVSREGGVPVQQPRARRDRLLRALGDAVPDPQRVGARLEDHGGAAVLQHGERAARAAPARAHRRRSAHRVAQGRRRRICGASSPCPSRPVSRSAHC
jgi:c-type cytochrome biogenesis protein CcmF